MSNAQTNKESVTSPKSCLSPSAKKTAAGGVDNNSERPFKPENSNASRTDRHGNLIEKGGKNHQISFVDESQPGKSISEYKEVQAFKNSDEQSCCSLM
mmetsp:Transcript_24298/g.44610  ORF Transcript_24298/g.44610 Transcript_24298/m.44610 type:complete len:98 (+) Transcript_24298:76-369(+)